MRIFYRLIYGEKPATMALKKNAHLFTLLSIAWIPFSLLGVSLIGPDRFGRCIVFGALILHAVWIGAAIWCWITEKKRTVDVIETRPDVGFE